MAAPDSAGLGEGNGQGSGEADLALPYVESQVFPSPLPFFLLMSQGNLPLLIPFFLPLGPLGNIGLREDGRRPHPLLPPAFFLSLSLSPAKKNLALPPFIHSIN